MSLAASVTGSTTRNVFLIHQKNAHKKSVIRVGDYGVSVAYHESFPESQKRFYATKECSEESRRLPHSQTESARFVFSRQARNSFQNWPFVFIEQKYFLS